jgi:folate-binding protein YgfZ
MGLTALQAHGQALGAKRVSEYRGAASAACFSDPQGEFAVLRGECAVYDLGFRQKISLTGADRVRWLNGMVTNNIRDLAVGRGVYAFLLNPQGHILDDLYAYNRGQSILVDTDADQLEKMIATFDHYIIMDDVVITKLDGHTTSLGIAGPKSRAVLEAAGIMVPAIEPLEVATPKCECDCAGLECALVRGEDPGRESYEIWIAPPDVLKLWNGLVAAGAKPVGWETLELDRIVSGIPRYGVDLRDRDLPQETGQGRALNFNKGCYVGQEIVERIRSRGAVHRTLSGFLLDGVVAIPAGTKIIAGEKEIGEVTSTASINVDGRQKTVGLGYIRREANVPGRAVDIAGASAMVAPVPISDELLRRANDALQQRPA